MARLSAREAREVRQYIGSHEAKLRKRLADGETHEEIAVHIGVSVRTLRHMLDVVLPGTGVPKCQCPLSPTGRNEPTVEPGRSSVSVTSGR